ncbi:MAG TPA: hypothetical protein VFE47_18455 [Tepidisphaeraceae bacterium]|nr:hypothetical protein [Tepidisphaeraceae bacterium]
MTTAGRFALSVVGFLFLTAGLASAGPQPRADWLIDPSSFTATVSQDANKLTLDNGLARRVILLSPNAATIDLQDLVNGEHLLRAIAPEARLTIDGTEYAVGGLAGERVANFIRADSLNALRDNPDSYHFTRWTQGPIEARMAWKKRPEWLSRDLPWPPPGKHVVLYFSPPGKSSTAQGPVLFEDKFTGKLDAGWIVHASRSSPRASFTNEGKAGEIMALPDTAVYAQRQWSKNAASVEVLVDAGDDETSNSWGPGLALSNGKQTVSFVIRPNSRQYEVDSDDGEILHGRFDRAKPCRLRAVLDGHGNLICESAQGEAGFARIAVVPFSDAPTRLRIGKVGKHGKGADASADGTLVRCHVSQVTLRGEAPPVVAVPRADLPAVEIHYEIYDGIPLFSKWMVVKNGSAKTVRVDAFTSDELRLAEPESAVNVPPVSEKPNIWVETDYAFGDMSPLYAQPAVHLVSDPAYPTQVAYPQNTPCLLKCKPPIGPSHDVAPGGEFETFRAFELLLDSTERERRTLAQRRMYRIIAPWTAENPLIFHKTGSDPKTIRDAIEQCHEVGFEMVIMTFGSGFNIESKDPKYIATYKQLSAEAKAKGVALGGYSLLASRSAADPKDNTQGSPAMYGVMPCLGSNWGHEYLAQVKNFCKEADLGVFENDGSYPGDLCASHDHPFHHGLEDSQWVQWRAITDLYKWCRSQGIYLNIPDWYFLSGGSKCGMGYRETNWSLPRADQELIERQNIFDGTWNKTASMGWMFVPLSQYHGGGAAATIEPLNAHRDHYEARLANLLGAGVQACYRGPRLYDTDATKALVKKWVTFYKTHRQVLDGDIIHLRRASGLDWDGWLHVNPQGTEKGLLMVYNPLSTEIRQTIHVPLYYTGLTGTAVLREEDGKAVSYTLGRDYGIELPVVIPPAGRTWFVIGDK